MTRRGYGGSAPKHPIERPDSSGADTSVKRTKGPQLTQRKIDKLRDALNVVRECDQVQTVDAEEAKSVLADAYEMCDLLERVLNRWKQ